MSPAKTKSKRSPVDVSAENVAGVSALQQARLAYKPRVNPLLKGAFGTEIGGPTKALYDEEIVKSLFPNLYGQPIVNLVQHTGSEATTVGRRLRIGVVLSGGPAPGGHNVVSGLFDYLDCRNTTSALIGFLGGPSGIVDGEYVTLDAAAVAPFRNQGGFHIIGSGRTKISQPAQFEASRKVVSALNLDGLVVVGGDDSNTNAMILAENFKKHDIPCAVIGCPKTIDNDLRNEQVETSFGFDTATKIYANLCANLGHDAVSARKTYHFVRVMGRSASAIALECALQTRPNLCFIGEEVKKNGTTLTDIVKETTDLVCARAAAGKHYGLVLLPEGLVEFMPDIEKLIGELNEILASGEKIEFADVVKMLSEPSGKLLELLPRAIADQLMLERDPHGNVQVAKIEAERLLIGMVEVALEERKAAGTYSGKFTPQPHYMGYEGRCALPTNFDANYCYSLGHVAGALIDAGKTGYIATVSGLTRAPEEWTPAGFPLTMMMNIERRKGKDTPVIKKMLVELDSPSYKIFKDQRAGWMLSDDFRQPGPIQYWGPSADETTITLASHAKAN